MKPVPNFLQPPTFLFAVVQGDPLPSRVVGAQSPAAAAQQSVGGRQLMHKQRLLCVAGHSFRALFGLAIWLYISRQLTQANDITAWILRGGFAFTLLGGLTNVAVVTLNRGFMPVRVDVIDGRKRLSYEPIHRGTRLWFLGDCIRLGTYYASPGDLLLYAGLGLTLAGAVLSRFVL